MTPRTLLSTLVLAGVLVILAAGPLWAQAGFEPPPLNTPVDVSLDFQLNRLVGLGGGRLEDVREVAPRIRDLDDWKREFLALAVSLEDLAHKSGNAKAQVLADALDQANGTFLNSNKSPSRKVGELDTRGSHFYLALYWAQALSGQDEDQELKTRFTPVAQQMAENEAKIVDELNTAQGRTLAIGGYYHPDKVLTAKAMRPSETFNRLLAAI